MQMSVIDSQPLFELRAEIEIAAAPEVTYSVVSDLPRSGDWSPECRGGEWISGSPPLSAPSSGARTCARRTWSGGRR